MEPPRTVPAELTKSYPKPIAIPKGTKTRLEKITTGEFELLQAIRARQQALAVKSASLVSLQFLADQVMTTGQSLALFAGLAARIIWLRKQRRRRGKGEQAWGGVPRGVFS